MIITFGKHTGKDTNLLAKSPDGREYLQWGAQNLKAEKWRDEFNRALSDVQLGTLEEQASATCKIDTIEQYLAARESMHPVFCANTLVVNRDLVLANTYNPNSVPNGKMDLLAQSIIDNGFAFPVVTIYDTDLGKLVIIDGFHLTTRAQ